MKSKQKPRIRQCNVCKDLKPTIITPAKTTRGGYSICRDCTEKETHDHVDWPDA